MRRTIGWLAAAVIVTLVFGSMYVAFQQSGRMAANMAPAATADAEVQLLRSAAVPVVPAVPRVELTPDSGAFVIVYGLDGNPESGTATLHGALPVVPAGVLDTARSAGSDIVTWQPEPGLRMAIIARSLEGKVVVAGQSLTPYEAANGRILALLGLGWLASVLVLGTGFAAALFLRRRHGT